jgi:hypothetical protein
LAILLPRPAVSCLHGRLSSTLGAAIATSRGTSQQGSKHFSRQDASAPPLSLDACTPARFAVSSASNLPVMAVQLRPERSAASARRHESKCQSLAPARFGSVSLNLGAPRFASCRPLAAAAPAEYGPCVLPWRASASRIKACRCSRSTARLARRQLSALVAGPPARVGRRRLTGRSSRPAPAGRVWPLQVAVGHFPSAARRVPPPRSAQLNVRLHVNATRTFAADL